jgi:hypothetical protein
MVVSVWMIKCVDIESVGWYLARNLTGISEKLPEFSRGRSAPGKATSCANNRNRLSFFHCKFVQMEDR